MSGRTREARNRDEGLSDSAATAAESLAEGELVAAPGAPATEKILIGTRADGKKVYALVTTVEET